MDKINFILDSLNINLTEPELLELQKLFSSQNISFINTNFSKYQDLILTLKNFDDQINIINQDLNLPILNELSRNISKLQILIFIYISSQEFNIPDYQDTIQTLNIISQDIIQYFQTLDESIKKDFNLLLQYLLQNFKILENNIIIKNTSQTQSNYDKFRDLLLNFIIKKKRYPINKGKLPISQEEFEQIILNIKKDISNLERQDSRQCSRTKTLCSTFKHNQSRCNSNPSCIYENFSCIPRELRCKTMMTLFERQELLSQQAQRLKRSIKYYNKYLFYKNKYLQNKNN